MKQQFLDKKKNTVVWAVDPFDDAPPAQAVHVLLRRTNAVAPVYVHSLPAQTLERGILGNIDRLEKVLTKFVGHHGPAIEKPELLLEETGSRKGAVRRLLEFCREKKAPWIALSSHGRAGLQRFVFGSFAEAVLRESPVPILFLSETKHSGNLALFPTDFSSASRRAFRKFLPFAKSAGLEVILFHAISFPAPVFASQAAGIPFMITPETFYPEQRARANQEAAHWLKMAEDNGVRARLHLHEEGIGLLTGELILEVAADLRVSLIAMASFSGPLDRVIMGSAAFQVFRARKFPVWICGPKVLTSPARESLRTQRKSPRRPESRIR